MIEDKRILEKYLFIPSERVGILERDLKNIPDFTWLLTDPHMTHDSLQGDLLSDLVLVFQDPTGSPKSQSFPVMVLNNACDLPEGRLDWITAVPIIDFKSQLEQYRKAKLSNYPANDPEAAKKANDAAFGYAKDVKHNKISEIFYLPPFSTYEEGALALLSMPCPVPANLYREANAAGKRVKSLSQSGFYYFLMKLTDHFVRLESHEVTRL